MWCSVRKVVVVWNLWVFGQSVTTRASLYLCIKNHACPIGQSKEGQALWERKPSLLCVGPCLGESNVQVANFLWNLTFICRSFIRVWEAFVSWSPLWFCAYLHHYPDLILWPLPPCWRKNLKRLCNHPCCALTVNARGILLIVRPMTSVSQGFFGCHLQLVSLYDIKLLPEEGRSCRPKGRL
jgi:hypothetical protein